ncbi:Bifunctional glycosyltransferase pgtA [Frankliniella fusca]|uniref:Bifunctional glycosyltransferase pgtA n=1 Tax=Frankliniella fusca TaxID=407009 RepID=A0AAE1HZ93_9NEOP|nr:Bifunctional glycosyltransferase pgtA [Frankliniella fusca]
MQFRLTLSSDDEENGLEDLQSKQEQGPEENNEVENPQTPQVQHEVFGNPQARGVTLSSKQLDILWKLDFELAHQYLGLPKRTCTAEPINWGNSMDSAAFAKLQDQIKRMWLRASLCFEAYLDENHGWGLRKYYRVINDESNGMDCPCSLQHSVPNWP